MKTIIWKYQDQRHEEAGTIYFRKKEDAETWLWARAAKMPTHNLMMMEFKETTDFIERIDIRDGDSITNYAIKEL